MRWGDIELPYYDLMTATMWANNSDYSLPGLDSYEYPQAQAHAFCLRDRQVAKAFYNQYFCLSYSMADYLSASRDLNFTDRRDRIYACSALPYNDVHGAMNIVPDYTCSFEETLKRFTMEHIRQTSSPSVLHYVHHDATSLDSDDPSWVPQWIPSAYVGFIRFFSHSAWSILSPRDDSLEAPVLIDDNILRVRGVIVDTVNYTSDLYDEDELDVSLVERMVTQNWNIFDNRSSHSPYPRALSLDIFLCTVASYGYIGTWSNFVNSKVDVYTDLQKQSASPADIDFPTYLANATPTGTDNFYSQAHQYMILNRLFLTGRGYIGQAKHLVEAGDIVAVIFGCKTPYILRETGTEGQYKVVGEALVAGKECWRDENDGGRMSLVQLGSDDSKDWVDWDDVEEQDIDLC